MMFDDNSDESPEPPKSIIKSDQPQDKNKDAKKSKDKSFLKVVK